MQYFLSATITHQIGNLVLYFVCRLVFVIVCNIIVAILVNVVYGYWFELQIFSTVDFYHHLSRVCNMIYM